MKKILGIIFLSWMCFGFGFAQKINIENRVTLDVPEKFIFIKGDVNSELIEPLLNFIGDNPKSYLIGTKKSVEFTKEYQENPEKVFQPIMNKMERKKFSSQSSAENFMAKEIKKLFKKKKYEGVIWLVFGESDLDGIDPEFESFVNEIKQMDNNTLKKEMNRYQKEWKKLTRDTFGEFGKYIKISRIIIKKNNFNVPIFQFSMNYKIKSLSGKVIFYAFIKDNKPIGLIYECINVCPKNNKSLEKIVSPTFFNSNVNKSVKLSNIKGVKNDVNLVENFEKLNDFYKSGVLTKEEFEKAKKKILN